MDPYEVLGVQYNSDWKTIRKAYKVMLLNTHPDKMGHSQFFNMVQEADQTIKAQFKLANSSKNYPKEKDTYSQDFENVQMQKPTEQFNINSFNKMFEEYSKLYKDTDPYLNGGYKTEQRLNYQEDIDAMKRKKIDIPQRQLVIHKEPEALPSLNGLENVEHLGINKVDDYTCRHGTDYMRAYSNEAEVIDNRPVYKNLDHIREVRSSQSFQLTEEDTRRQKRDEQKKAKLEQLRRRQVQENDRKYQNIYSYMHVLPAICLSLR